MHKLGSKLWPILARLFSTRMAGMYMLVFAAAIAIATFIENDYGTSAAQKLIFKARWFEVLLILFGLCIAFNVYQFRMFQQKKWATVLFHLSILVILAGSGITRYTGYEGMMSIREGSSSNTFLSAETYLNYEIVKGDRRHKIHDPVLFASLGKNKYKESFLIGSDRIDVELVRFIPNPKEVAEYSEVSGVPTVKIVIGGANGREEFYVSQGERMQLYGLTYNFTGEPLPGAFNLRMGPNGEAECLVYESYNAMVMATQTRQDIIPGSWQPLLLRSLYSNGEQNFVFGELLPKAQKQIISEKIKVDSKSTCAVELSIALNGEPQRIMVSGGPGVEGRPRVLNGKNISLSVSYGARKRSLPFSIALRDFEMERYPGTNNPAGYASDVTLNDARSGLKKDYRIFMNNILDHDGYRFFQSSYDPDELGTYLSVNNDFWGTWVSYIGYALLTIGLLWLFVDSKSRFTALSKKL
jgi:ResB-like family